MGQKVIAFDQSALCGKEVSSDSVYTFHAENKVKSKGSFQHNN